MVKNKSSIKLRLSNRYCTNIIHLKILDNRFIYKVKMILIALKKYLYFITSLSLIKKLIINKTSKKKSKVRKINIKIFLIVFNYF